MLFLNRVDKFRQFDIWLNAGLGLATLAGLSIGCFLVLGPIQNQMQSVRAEAVGYRDLIQRASEVANRKQKLTLELEKSRQTADELAQRIPAAPRESDFLHQISHLANRSGLEVTDYHPGGIEKRENHEEMEVRVDTRGEYEPLCRFLKEIDALPRLCRLTEMDISTDAKDSKLKADLLFRIYFAPPATTQVQKKG